MGDVQQKKMSPGHGTRELAAAQSLYKLGSVDQPFILGQGGDMKPDPFLRNSWQLKVIGARASFFIMIQPLMSHPRSSKEPPTSPPPFQEETLVLLIRSHRNYTWKWERYLSRRFQQKRRMRREWAVKVTKIHYINGLSCQPLTFSFLRLLLSSSKLKFCDG